MEKCRRLPLIWACLSRQSTGEAAHHASRVIRVGEDGGLSLVNRLPWPISPVANCSRCPENLSGTDAASSPTSTFGCTPLMPQRVANLSAERDLLHGMPGHLAPVRRLAYEASDAASCARIWPPASVARGRAADADCKGTPRVV